MVSSARFFLTEIQSQKLSIYLTKERSEHSGWLNFDY